MPAISDFILDLGNPTLANLQSRTGDLVILESGSDSDFGLTLLPAEVDVLQAQGRTVIAYLNVAVTDHNRTYWDDSWVDYSDPDNRDVGPVLDAASPPPWLKKHHEYAISVIENEDGSTTTITHGYIVDYTDSVWQQRVIDEAVRMVTPVAQGGLGYSGVFLDDVGRYYEAALQDPGYDMADAAQHMMAFVTAIVTAVRAVLPNAYVAVNSGPYIGWNSDQPIDPATLAYFDAIDALLMETQFGDAWGAVLANGTHWVPGHDFLAVERSWDSSLDPQAFADWARANGVVPHVAVNSDYAVPDVTPPPGTQGADLLTGGDGPNALDGLGGDDTILAGGGDDTVSGGGEHDFVHGQNGADVIGGGAGNDILWGGNGPDALDGGPGMDRAMYYAHDAGLIADLLFPGLNTGAAKGDSYTSIENLHGGGSNDDLRGDGLANILWGSGGNDSLHGRDGADHLVGGAGNDILWGGAGEDILNGGPGMDAAYYYAGAPGLIADLQMPSANTGTAAGDLYSGIENLHGTDQDDDLRGNADGNVIWGGGGDDTLHGRNGADNLVGGGGDDVLIGGFGGDVLNGGPGIDRAHYYGTDAGFIADLAMPGLNTGAAKGDSYIGVENLHGGLQDDDLRGDAGDNTIWGSGGDDTLRGRTGDDLLVGQAGADEFVYASGWDADTVAGFEDDLDQITLLNMGFATPAEALAFADQVGAHVVFDFGSGDSLTVLNTTIQQLENDLAV